MDVQHKECTIQVYYFDFVFMFTLTFSHITLFDTKKIPIKILLKMNKNKLYLDYWSESLCQNKPKFLWQIDAESLKEVQDKEYTLQI